MCALPIYRDWPPCFAALTVAAYPDLEPYKDRHVAIVHPDDWWDWLDKERDPLDILKPFPEGSFRVIGPPVQQGLSLFSNPDSALFILITNKSTFFDFCAAFNALLTNMPNSCTVFFFYSFSCFLFFFFFF